MNINQSADGNLLHVSLIETHKREKTDSDVEYVTN
jgi:hypothetical protein